MNGLDLFLTGMTGALAPFSNLAVNSCNAFVYFKIIPSSKLDQFWTTSLFL